MKNRIFSGIAIVAAIALVSGATILADAASGSQNDPLVTLSYLTDVFKPQILSEISKTEQELSMKFDAQIIAFESGLKPDQYGDLPDIPDSIEKFSVVTLAKGQSLTCSVGAEIMLRIGTATGFGSSPALVDYTTGSTLSAGSSLVTNHMYLITIEGNGITSTADLVRVLVRGSYTMK